MVQSNISVLIQVHPMCFDTRSERHADHSKPDGLDPGRGVSFGVLFASLALVAGCSLVLFESLWMFVGRCVA